MRFVADFPRQFSSIRYYQIGEVEEAKGSKTDLPEGDTTTESEVVAPLDKVIIKKREKKDDRKSEKTEGRDLGSVPY